MKKISSILLLSEAWNAYATEVSDVTATTTS